MVGILKKGGVVDGGCFRRSRSANSVNISSEVEVIQSTELPTSSTDLVANPVKNLSEVVTCHDVESSEELPQNNRSVSESGLESGKSSVSESESGVRTVEPEVASGGTEPPTESEASSFPSLPDRVLKTMGLLVNGKRVRDTLSDDDIENRFTSLCLAFKTDQLTLTTRMELQKRQRDLAESNMSTEVIRLKSAIHKLNRVYVDAESIENLTQIQTLVDILQQATARVSSSAEMFGAVQQEHRLSAATDVLMTHVENVKRSLEKMHMELDELKRILADNNIMLEENTDLMEEPTPRTHRYRSLAGIVTGTKKIGSKRRASIAAMPRPLGNSTESLKGQFTSPSSPVESKSRMANVVNAIRRKTSLSPVSPQSSCAEAREWSEQVQDTVEEIDEISEAQGATYCERSYIRSTSEEHVHDNKSQNFSVECPDNLMTPEEIHSEDDRKEEELVTAQTENLPNTFQTILKQVKRQATEIQFQITDLYENHRSTILEKFRWTVAAVLIGLAACFLVWVIFPSVDATSQIRRQTLRELLYPYV